MAYSDGLMVLGPELTTTQVEASATDIKDYLMPFPCQIESFGVVVTEDFVAQATDPVMKLQKKSTLGGSATDLVSLTVGNSNTTLYKGDGTSAAKTLITADTDIDIGQVVLAKRSAFPIKIAAGEIITFRHATAATGAGGAYTPVALIRVSGEDMISSNVWVDNS